MIQQIISEENLLTYWKKEFFKPNFENKKKVYLFTYQVPHIFKKILEEGVYRFSKNDYFKFSPYPKEGYKKIIERSTIKLQEDTMPIWAWYNHLGEAKPETFFKNRIEIGKPNALLLFLEIPIEEVFLTNYDNWSKYLFYEDDKNLSEARNREEKENLFNLIVDFKIDTDEIQAIIPEIKKEMIYYAGMVRKF